MFNLMNIRKSLSTKLSLAILVFAVPIFFISLGILFMQSRHMIRREATIRANSVLTTKIQRISRHLMTIETATNTYSQIVEESFQPDSLFAFTQRIVFLNSHIDGCSISAEPDMFPKYGLHFSAYTVRRPDSIETVIEEPYDYFNKVWYKTPAQKHHACWVVYYDESDSLELTLDGMIASYGRPLHRPDGRLAGIISTDLSLLRFSKYMSEEKPYPNSYFMMTDEAGRFLIHPDSTRLFTQTIYSGADPTHNPELFALGYEMTEGNQGNMMVDIDGVRCLVCYQPIRGTDWSMAIICPDSDVLDDYYQLTYVLIPLLFFGLLLIILLCYHTVGQAIRPLNELLDKSQMIASGNMEVHIPRSPREDVVGRLQNSFATMLQSLNFHMGSVRYTSGQMRERNEELAKATLKVQEAERQKTAFIQNVSHQIRTPLNIIMGFSQVLSDSQTLGAGISEEEMKSITSTMDHSAKTLSRMVLMLYDSSDSARSLERYNNNKEVVSVNQIAEEAIDFTQKHYPSLSVAFVSELPDSFTLQTNSLYLMRALRELLYNSGKYSDGQHVTFRITKTDTNVRFIVQDTGPGIPEAHRDDIFKFFGKVDDLSEGLGLGLPLAKSHAQHLGGDLTLDTSYTDGCRFILELPLLTEQTNNNE